MGGDQAAVSRLDAFFQQDEAGPNAPYYWAGNEVDMLAPWVYDYAGAPYKTQAEVHKLLDAVYANTPAGEPGNDDLGATSSWFVWGALGLYPQTSGAPVLALSAPIFPVAHLNLPNHHLTITAPGASDQGYINSLMINGHTSNRDWLPASDLVGDAGGSVTRTRLDVAISTTPNTRWAASTADEPPSYPAGPPTFPTGVVPATVTTTPANLTATAGSSTPATLTFTLGVGAYGDQASKIHQLNWTAQPPPGVTVSPASGTVPVTDKTATVTVSFDVASDAAQGFSAVGFALSDPQNVPLPTLTVPVAVIGPGDTATVCTTLGAANIDHGLTQQEGGDGTTAPVTVGGQSARSTTASVPGAEHVLPGRLAARTQRRLLGERDLRVLRHRDEQLAGPVLRERRQPLRVRRLGHEHRLRHLEDRHVPAPGRRGGRGDEQRGRLPDLVQRPDHRALRHDHDQRTGGAADEPVPVLVTSNGTGTE
jgi:hypothetical protein